MTDNTRQVTLPHTPSHRKVQAVPSSGPASWACGLGAFRRTPLGFRLCYHRRETFHHFRTRSPAFLLCTGPHKPCSWHCPSPQAASAGRLSQEGQPRSHSLCVSKNVSHSPGMVGRNRYQFLQSGVASCPKGLGGQLSKAGLFPTLVSPPSPPHPPLQLWVSELLVVLTPPSEHRCWRD